MPLTQREAALLHGWRSGFEEKVNDSLLARGASFEYEKLTLEYIEPERKRKYTPDFVVTTASGKKIIVETKGRWLRADRLKMQLVVKQHPKLDIRFVFQNPNQRISKTSATTYASWCQKNLGSLYAKGDIPDSWLME